MAVTQNSAAHLGIRRCDRTTDLTTFGLFAAAQMRRILSSLVRDRLGITAIEYAMIGSLIAICAIAAKASIGNSLSGFFTTVATSL